MSATTPQEQSLMPTKISDENQNFIVGNDYETPSNWILSGYGYGNGLYWATDRRMALSPDGKKLAYISKIDNAYNIMVRGVDPESPSTQRTFRRAATTWWGSNGRLYFNDNTVSKCPIQSTEAEQGSLIKQHTSNSNDWDPALTKDGSLLYFTRFDGSGPSIWSLNMRTNELKNYTKGYNAIPVGNSNTTILCTRNQANGRSEIWMIDLSKGDETLILSDSEKGFTSPYPSADGKWILVVGSSLSTITGKYNTDIYAVKSDGTQLTQLTYHPAIDTNPVFSKDGKYIYFISNRANEKNLFNIWRIENPLF